MVLIIIVSSQFQLSETEIPLGRVYVDDADDWDVTDKTYLWKKSHPSFRLDSSTGELLVVPGIRPDR